MAIIEWCLQGCLDKMVICADENGLKFSPTKTFCVHFCNKNGVQPEPSLKRYGQQLHVVHIHWCFLQQEAEFNSTYKIHERQLQEGLLHLLRIISGRDWGSDLTTLLRIYQSHIRSRLDYGCIVYGSTRRSYLTILDPIATKV